VSQADHGNGSGPLARACAALVVGSQGHVYRFILLGGLVYAGLWGLVTLPFGNSLGYLIAVTVLTAVVATLAVTIHTKRARRWADHQLSPPPARPAL
jgi:hypothetical protein